MQDTPLAMVSACLWDLRAQCEQQLRSLTDAQRIADQFHGSSPAAAELLKRRLAASVESVLRSNAVIREATQDCVDLVEHISAGTQEPLRP